jgi:hypothetical protein
MKYQRREELILRRYASRVRGDCIEGDAGGSSAITPWAVQSALKFSHSIGFRGGVCHRSSKASGREDLEIEQPVACGDSAAFDFHSTLAGMLGATLVRNQVVQMCQPDKKRLLAPVWMMEPFHHEQFPRNGVRGLIQQRAGDGHLRVFEHRIPARFLLLNPVPYACALSYPSRGGHVIGQAAQPLTQRKHAPALPLSRSGQQDVELWASGLAHGGREGRELLRELGARVTHWQIRYWIGMEDRV